MISRDIWIHSTYFFQNLSLVAPFHSIMILTECTSYDQDKLQTFQDSHHFQSFLNHFVTLAASNRWSKSKLTIKHLPFFKKKTWMKKCPFANQKKMWSIILLIFRRRGAILFGDAMFGFKHLIINLIWSELFFYVRVAF